jgi:putative aldouronate transport system substrate-binding protein
MVDQDWDFQKAADAIKSQGLSDKGCEYVPLGVTISEDVKNQYFTGGTTLNSSNGVGITVSCKDPEGALKFMDDLLSQEALTLRGYGIKDVDYSVDENGVYSRTPEQIANSIDTTYKANNLCSYSYFPAYTGMNPDGINAAKPSEQPNEVYEGLSDKLKKCYDAYGHKTAVDFLGVNEQPGPWFPMYSHSNNMTTSTPGGTAWAKMGECKHQELPKVIMADDFEQGWSAYMDAYNACKPEDFISEMQTELDKRVEAAKKYQ